MTTTSPRCPFYWPKPAAAGALLLVCAARALAGPGAPPQARIDWPASVRVTPGQPLTLGRVAHVRSNDLALQRALMALPLAPALEVGDTLRLQRGQFNPLLLNSPSWRGARVESAGASATEVLVGAQRIAGADVARTARQHLHAWLLGQTGTSAYLEVVREPHDTSMPPGEVEMRVRPPLGAASAQRMTVWTDVWHEGQFFRALPTTFEVLAVAPGIAARLWPAAAPRIVRGPGMGVAEPAPAPTPAPHGVAPNPSASPPMVRRGQAALLTSAVGSISVQTRVQALQDGALGQAIQVKAPATQELIHARVTGLGHVEVLR